MLIRPCPAASRNASAVWSRSASDTRMRLRSAGPESSLMGNTLATGRASDALTRPGRGGKARHGLQVCAAGLRWPVTVSQRGPELEAAMGMGRRGLTVLAAGAVLLPMLAITA